MDRGDVVRPVSPTGGGFGDPLERDLSAITTEIEGGMLSRTRAQSVYGAECDAHGDIDPTAMAQTRRKLAKETPKRVEFNFCAERQLQEKGLAYRRSPRSRLVRAVAGAARPPSTRPERPPPNVAQREDGYSRPAQAGRGRRASPAVWRKALTAWRAGCLYAEATSRASFMNVSCR
jgi:hypothetical protein